MTIDWHIVTGSVAAAIGLITLAVAGASFWLQKKSRAEAKRANLEFVSAHPGGAIWRFMHFVNDPETHALVGALFESHIYNRGPAVAERLEWSVTANGMSLEIPRHPPHRLFQHEEEQFILKIPLAPNQGPASELVRICTTLTDDDSRKTVNWCLRFAGEPGGDPHAWTITQVDCVSRRVVSPR